MKMIARLGKKRVNQHNKKILMIFVEPTPYILDLLERGFVDINKRCDIIFLTENLTQKWDLKTYNITFSILKSKATLFADIFFKRKYRLVQIAGWGHSFTVSIILASRFFFVPVAVDSDTPLGMPTSRLKKTVKKIFYPILFKFPKMFLPSGTRQARYLNYYGVSNKKIIKEQMTVDVAYIQNFVKQIDAAKRDELRLSYNTQPDDIVFLFVGRLVAWKGIRELISAFELMHHTKERLGIVGTGDLDSEIWQATNRNNKITYFGKLHGDELWSTYHAADVFVLPSHKEPWGLVVNEAMAAGLPIIANKHAGCVDDLISEKIEGLLIDRSTVSSLCDAMRFLLNNPEKRKAMARSAFTHISHWTLQNEANNIIFAWEKAMKMKY